MVTSAGAVRPPPPGDATDPSPDTDISIVFAVGWRVDSDRPRVSRSRRAVASARVYKRRLNSRKTRSLLTMRVNRTVYKQHWRFGN